MKNTATPSTHIAKSTKLWFAAFGVFGFLGVALGAFGAHALKEILDPYEKAIYEKAVFYQIVHAFSLFAVGLLQHIFQNKAFSIPGWGFLTGIILFSGSLYVLSITGMRWVGIITPFGGLALLFAWASLVLLLVKSRF